MSTVLGSGQRQTWRETYEGTPFMITHRVTRLFALLLAFALFATACGGSDSTSESAESADVETSQDDNTAEADDAEAPADEAETEEADEPAADEPEEETAAIVTEDTDDSDLTPVKGGTLRIGVEAEVDGINPTGSALSQPGLLMANQVFDSLVRVDADDNWTPFLAESMTPSEDLKSWTLKLREGILFHDGTPLNAEAIRANFEVVIADPLVGLAVAPYYPKVEDGALEVLDEYTVRFNLLDSNANFPTSFIGQLGFVASPAWLAAAAEDPTLNQAPVGTGPFKYESRSQDSVTRFVRNDDWWGGEVYLDAVEFLPVTDPDVRANLLLEGGLEGLVTTNIASAETVAGDPTIQTFLDDTGDESFVMLNTSSAPFDDIRARQALTFATPRDNYNTLFGLGIQRPANSMFTPESRYYNPDVVQESDDPEQAIAIAAEYCADLPDNCTDGKINMELQWSGPSVVQTRIAEVLDEGWSAAFNVEFQEIPQDSHIQETAFGLYNAVTWRQFGAVNPADDGVWLLCRTIGGISLNWPKYCDESRDALILEAMASQDEARRTEIFQELAQKINEDYTYVFLLHTLWSTSLSDNVRGMCDTKSPDGDDLRCLVNGRAWFSNTFISE